MKNRIDNLPKNHLRNLYNILFYNKSTQIDFDNLFFAKIFEINAIKNNFIEIDFRILLYYENKYLAEYVTLDFKMYDYNDEEIYVYNFKNNDFIIDDNVNINNKNIFYNFEKDIKNLKIVINFRIISSNNNDKIWYIPINTDRLIIKHFGL